MVPSLQIDTNALHHNLQIIRKELPASVKLLSVVKADAYGLGAEKISAICSDYADYLGVARVEEAVQLWNYGISKPILILSEFPQKLKKEYYNHAFEFTVMDGEQPKKLSTFAQKERIVIPIHIKVDTGMNRAGIRWDEAVEQIREISKLLGLQIRGIFSHFAVKPIEKMEFAEKQYSRFLDIQTEVKKFLPPTVMYHMANSHAAFALPQSQFDMVRIGGAMYGNCDEKLLQLEELRSVVSFMTEISHMKQVKRGEPIGYDGEFTAPRDMKIANVSCGYADFHPLSYQKGFHVLIHGKQCPIVGKVSMDQMTVDVTDIPDAEDGDTVVLIGKQGEEQISALDWSRHTQLPLYEIFCGIGQRVQKGYIS